MKRIVAVDDEGMSLEILEEALVEQGYQVESFRFASQALDFLKAGKNTIDLFLLDIRMQEQSGLDVLKFIRLPGSGYENAPVIMVSAFATEEYKQKAFDLGASDYISKPFNSEELLEKVSSCLSSGLQTTP